MKKSTLLSIAMLVLFPTLAIGKPEINFVALSDPNNSQLQIDMASNVSTISCSEDTLGGASNTSYTPTVTPCVVTELNVRYDGVLYPAPLPQASCDKLQNSTDVTVTTGLTADKQSIFIQTTCS